MLKSFRLRNLEVFPNTILSPMDGVTDAPFRRLCRVLSGNRMGLLVSEFVPTDGDAVFCLDGHKQLKFFPEERPFGVQIFGRFPDRMAAAAKKIAENLHPEFIEVNAGCPAPKVAGKGSGSGLLRDLPRLQEILHDVRAALDSSSVDIPLTLKCRIGWDDESINVMETAAAKIPVIGNGDVNSVAVARERIETYGVSGVSIGRGAMHNPWIFGQIADAWEDKPAHEITAEEALDVFPLYYKFKLEDGSSEMGALGRLKQLAARLCKGFDDPEMQVRQTLLTAQTPQEFFERLEVLRNGVVKFMRYDPNRLVNLNGAKETELKFGDQFAGR